MKDGLYLYLDKHDNFLVLPEELKKILGKLNYVMSLDLSKYKKLAQVDIETVEKSIKNKGFFLQVPPNYKPRIYHGNDI
tara:strand:- start:6707 stop:6943 length:237 start_codon:yes stop_codon:yes gene_type:complete